MTQANLVTAEQFACRPGAHARRELRQGRIVSKSFHGFLHGELCGNIHYHVDRFVRRQQCGRTLLGGAGLITERDPDTVRGGDITYYSFQRMPKGESPIGYAGALPEIVFEVVSPTNTRKEIARKTGEYLQAGVNVVCVVDSQFKTVNLHYPDRPDEKLQGEDLLTFAELLGFTLPVARFFE